MTMTTYDRKRLWARSGNICSFPGCGVELASAKKGARVGGEEAHVKGEKPGTARYDPNQSSEERECYENRILLCPNHHVEVDAYPDRWPVDKLLQIKAKHEQQVEMNKYFPNLMGDLLQLVQRYPGPASHGYSVTRMMKDNWGLKRVVLVDAAAEEGVNTGINVTRGQKIEFFARGLVTFDAGVTFATPEGVLCNEYGFPAIVRGDDGSLALVVMPSETANKTDGTELGKAGSLYGWIGNNVPKTAFFIGSRREIEVTQEGTLYLAVNDASGTFADNDGEFRVDIRIVDKP